MNTIAAAARRAGALFVEPPPARAAPAGSVDVVVTSLGAGAGASTVARGLAIALRRLRPVELSGAGGSAAVAAGPGTAVVRDTKPAAAASMSHRGSGRVLVAVGDGRRPPAIAALVRDVLARRHDRVILVGNRVRDAGAWSGAGALSVPDSRLGALLVERGRRPPGAMGAAFAELAARVLPPPGSA